MRIDKIQTGNKTYNQSKQPRKSYSTLSFKRSNPSIKDMITESLPAKKAIKKMKELEWLKGEMGGILITALGTGAVAYWPIAYNPWVKAPEGATEEEKENVDKTKKYTAWRQPISALCTIAFQVAALTPIDKGLAEIFNREEYAKNFLFTMNQSSINNKTFIEKIIKKEFKAEGKSKPSYLEGFKKGFSNISKQRDEFDDLFKQRVTAYQNNQIDAVAKEFAQTGKIRAGKEFLSNNQLAELINNQIDSYISDAQKLKINNDGLTFYSKRAKVLMENKEYLQEIFKDAPNDTKSLTKFLNDLLAKETNPEVKELIQEIIDKPADIQKNRINRTLNRIKNIEKMCSSYVGGYTHDNYLSAMGDRNTKLDKLITYLKEMKISDTKNATDKTITETMAKVIEGCSFDKNDAVLKSILQDTDTFHFDKKQLSTKVHKDVTKLYKKLVENHYKALNQAVKVVIGVFITLPITCNALNWVYPRFMKVVFPDLAGVKAKNEDKNKEASINTISEVNTDKKVIDVEYEEIEEEDD